MPYSRQRGSQREVFYLATSRSPLALRLPFTLQAGTAGLKVPGPLEDLVQIERAVILSLEGAAIQTADGYGA